MNSIATLAQETGLTIAGWTVMIACITLVCSLMIFCYIRVLREPRHSERQNTSQDVATEDTHG